MSSFNTIVISLIGGVLPALVWLWFWLKEDKRHPEPKSRIILVFLSGMISVFIVLPLEKLVFDSTFTNISLITIILWASIEELVKFSAAYLTALRSKVADEPIDAVIYMITAALGFSALENTLFVFNVIDKGGLVQSLITGNSRFLGATLLHTASSAAIGIMIGLSYYKKSLNKRLFLLAGVSIAILLHTVFNLLIINNDKDLFFVFSGVWVLIVCLIVIIEKIKKIRS